MNKQNFPKPKVFISYSWDSDEHRNRVKHFVLKLRSDNIDVIYDGDTTLGDRITKFMENSIIQCDVVLIICTPQYKQKADGRIAGVGYENNLITAELYKTHCENKFIPVLFEGTWKKSVPAWAEGKLGVDLTDSTKNIFEYKRLLNNLIVNKNEITFLYSSNYEVFIENKNCSDNIEDKTPNLDEQFTERFTKIFGAVEDIINGNQETAIIERHSVISDIVKYHIFENMEGKCEKYTKSFCPRDIDNILSDFILFQEKGDVNEKNKWRKFSLLDNCKSSTALH